MPRPKDPYDEYRCLSARSNREASESQPPSPPGSSLGPGHFISSTVKRVGSPARFVWGKLSRTAVGLGGRSSAVRGDLVLGGAEDRPRVLDLHERDEAIAAHRLEVLEREPERHRLALPHANRRQLPHRMVVAQVLAAILAARDRDGLP